MQWWFGLVAASASASEDETAGRRFCYHFHLEEISLGRGGRRSISPPGESDLWPARHHSPAGHRARADRMDVSGTAADRRPGRLPSADTRPAGQNFSAISIMGCVCGCPYRTVAGGTETVCSFLAFNLGGRRLVSQPHRRKASCRGAAVPHHTARAGGGDPTHGSSCRVRRRAGPAMGWLTLTPPPHRRGVRGAVQCCAVLAVASDTRTKPPGARPHADDRRTPGPDPTPTRFPPPPRRSSSPSGLSVGSLLLIFNYLSLLDRIN